MVVKENCGADCGSTVIELNNMNNKAPGDDDFADGGDSSTAGRSIGNVCAYNFSIKTANKCWLDIGSTGRVSIDTQAVPTHTKVNAFSVYDATACSVAKIFHKATANNVATGYDMYSNGANAAFRNWRLGGNISECGEFRLATSETASGEPGCARVVITSSGTFALGKCRVPCTQLHLTGVAGAPSGIMIERCSALAVTGAAGAIRWAHRTGGGGALRFVPAGLDAPHEKNAGCMTGGIRFFTSRSGGCYCETARMAHNGNFGVGEATPCYRIDSSAEVGFGERASRPPRPCEGKGVLWVSDGTCLGDCGDMMYAVTQGGCTRYNTVGDFSSACGW